MSADYGPPESSKEEGTAIIMIVAGLILWVGGLAYAASALKVVLVAVGVLLNLGAVVMLYQAKTAADALRQGESS